VFLTRSLNVTPKPTEQHLISPSDKSVACVTNNKRQRSTVCTTEAVKLTTDGVVNWIDYCNAVLAGVHDIHLRQLQGVLNAAARLIVYRRKYDSISSTMRDLLHWLPVHQRIQFKMCLCSSVLTTWRQSTSLITASQSLPILDVATFVRLHVVTLLSHGREQPIMVHAVLPWQARPRGTH